MKKNSIQDISIKDRLKHYTPTVISLKIKDDKIAVLYSFGLSFKGCLYDLNTNTFTDGVIRNYPGIGIPTYWQENLIGVMPSVQENLDLFKNYEYLRGIPIKFEHQYPDSDNPIITESITKI